MKSFFIDVVLWVLASPILLLQFLLRFVKRCVFWRRAYTAQIRCRNCGGQISLVGIWRADRRLWSIPRRPPVQPTAR